MNKNVLLVDDHAAVRHGLRSIFGGVPGIQVVGEAANSHELLSGLAELEPDVVSLDLSMPGLCGPELIALLRSRRPGLRILVVSMYADTHQAFQALRAGANGYVTKSSPASTLALALQEVASGRHFIADGLAQAMVFDAVRQEEGPIDRLSPREREILRLIVSGASNVIIADRLYLSAKTVSTHKSSVMRKLKVSSMSELILLAHACGIKGPHHQE
jgi:DNA-binding NarL/FixJ family response regulator